jgi:hypothetical protein
MVWEAGDARPSLIANLRVQPNVGVFFFDGSFGEADAIDYELPLGRVAEKLARDLNRLLDVVDPRLCGWSSKIEDEVELCGVRRARRSFLEFGLYVIWHLSARRSHEGDDEGNR